MALAPRTRDEALAYAANEWAHGQPRWLNLCQMFVRSAWGLPPLFGSAWAQWQGADKADKHEGGDPADAPLGSALCYKGSSVFGHIVVAARPFKDETPAAWSNCLVRHGYIDKAARTAPVTRWGQRYLGYLTAVNGYDLQLGRPEAEPVAKEPRRYGAVVKAGDSIAAALATARRRGDEDDITVLTRELTRLRRMAETLEKERT